MSALDLAAMNVSAGQAGLGLIVIFCLAAIWAAAGDSRDNNNKKER